MVVEDQRAKGSGHSCRNHAEDESRKLSSDIGKLERQVNVHQGGCGWVRQKQGRTSGEGAVESGLVFVTVKKSLVFGFPPSPCDMADNI